MELVNETKEALVARVGALERRFAELRNSMRASAALPNWRLTPQGTRPVPVAARERHRHERDGDARSLRHRRSPGSQRRDVHVAHPVEDEPHSVKIETINRTGYRLVDRLVWTKTLKLDAVEH
ncbi:helix-turn-helix domain-containing protein [Bradyrhizobium liaoningense]|uniref:helix-turn-helix domain-containing protein n=1 Tax=Bradyrhizobium liaoningense TaxID=43992 RepID=UPI002012E773|nr:helix-turn-helix domain-containing protein [Bradyrhizobium liaoningense]